MKKILIPLILLLLGVGGGVGAGLFFAAPEQTMPAGEQAEETPSQPEPVTQAPPPTAIEDREYARLNNQFIVPIVNDGKVSSMVVLSLSLEVTRGSKDSVLAYEPRLRDAFLQVLFDHANVGGFDGAFTMASNMRVLREALRSAATQNLGDTVIDVLIIDIVRQDINR